ncbi:MAG: hypothetical protein ACLTR8_13135 [Oscillospiraceae bacterium]
MESKLSPVITIKYEAPAIEKIEINTQFTTVLGNCSGWKSEVY